MRKEWEATVTRDGRFWLIQVDGLDGATQARNLREVDLMATEFVAIMTEQEIDDVTVTWRLELPKEVRTHLEAVEASRRAEAVARQAAASESRQAARSLRARQHSEGATPGERRREDDALGIGGYQVVRSNEGVEALFTSA